MNADNPSSGGPQEQRCVDDETETMPLQRCGNEAQVRTVEVAERANEKAGSTMAGTDKPNEIQLDEVEQRYPDLVWLQHVGERTHPPVSRSWVIKRADFNDGPLATRMILQRRYFSLSQIHRLVFNEKATLEKPAYWDTMGMQESD
jgi:hypothetical protein